MGATHWPSFQLHFTHPWDLRNPPKSRGTVTFQSTHLGPLAELDDRTRPTDEPFQKMWLGTSIPSNDQRVAYDEGDEATMTMLPGVSRGILDSSRESCAT